MWSVVLDTCLLLKDIGGLRTEVVCRQVGLGSRVIIHAHVSIHVVCIPMGPRALLLKDIGGLRLSVGPRELGLITM